MKIKTSELIGTALDWAVAIIEYEQSPTHTVCVEDGKVIIRIKNHDDEDMSWYKSKSSTDWAQGGPIGEREKISASTLIDIGLPNMWGARYPKKNGMTGPTELVAKMRCYVASKLGDEVDVPEELT